MQLVKVKYVIDSQEVGGLSTSAYTYFSEADLKVGDEVTVPVRNRTSKAVVCEVDVDESEIVAFKDKVKVIPAEAKASEKTIEEMEREADESLDATEKVWESEAEAELAEQEAKAVAIETAIATIRVKPQQDPAVVALSEQAERLLNIAKNRVITRDTDLTPATEDLSVIAKVKKTLSEIKANYVKPIKSHLDDVNAAFNMILKPLEEADSVTRTMMLSYRRAVEERANQAAELNRQAEELARKQAEFSGTGEFTVDTTPVDAPVPVAKVRTDIGSAGVMKVVKWELVDFAAVPDKFKVLDSAAITKLVKAGGSIPGIRVYQEETLRVNAR